MRVKKPDLMFVLTIAVGVGVLITTTLQAVATNNTSTPLPEIEQVATSVDTTGLHPFTTARR